MFLQLRDLTNKMKKLKHISEFKEGEMLIRPKPMIISRIEFDEIVGANVLVKERIDASYGGIPLEYVGVTKEKIYFKFQSNNKLGIKFGIPYDIFQDGWAKHVESKNLKEPEGKVLDLKTNINNLLYYLTHIKNMERNFNSS